jgi:hypothetical protein
MFLFKPKSVLDAVVRGIVYGATLAVIARWLVGMPPFPWLE